MRDYREGQEDKPSTGERLETARNVLRLTATAIGLGIIIVGLVMALRISSVVWSGLNDPDGFSPKIERWERAIGGERLNISIDGRECAPGRLLAAVFLAVGACLLVWIAMGIMFTGGKIVSLTAGDREAVKKILRHAFGPEGKPRKQTQAGDR